MSSVSILQLSQISPVYSLSHILYLDFDVALISILDFQAINRAFILFSNTYTLLGWKEDREAGRCAVWEVGGWQIHVLN